MGYPLPFVIPPLGYVDLPGDIDRMDADLVHGKPQADLRDARSPVSFGLPGAFTTGDYYG